MFVHADAIEPRVLGTRIRHALVASYLGVRVLVHSDAWLVGVVKCGPLRIGLLQLTLVQPVTLCLVRVELQFVGRRFPRPVITPVRARTRGRVAARRGVQDLIIRGAWRVCVD